ncbi:30741_t:CDS:2, partial [Gigaspora margarita]
HSMSTLSEKLAGIVLPIDNFSSYLDFNGAINNVDLAKQNFQYAGEKLCDIWWQDHIYGKEVFIKYVDKQINPFNKVSDIMELDKNSLSNIQKSGNCAIMDDCLSNYSPNEKEMLNVLILCLSD